MMNKQKIIQILKERHAQGWPMNAKAVREDARTLYYACRTYFGTYRESVEAAGIDYASVSLRRRWTSENVIQALKERAAQGLSMRCGAVDRDNQPLCHACRRYYGSYDAALEAAGFKASVKRRRWSYDAVIEALKERYAQGLSISEKVVSKDDKPLLAACRTYFGSYGAAVAAARVKE